MIRLYRAVGYIFSPLAPLWLWWRGQHGKEDMTRQAERLGYAAFPRPSGTLIWLHAASVGEANSLLPFIQALQRRFSTATLLLTTGTVTSAHLMKIRLPERVLHQFVPLDLPNATKRFLRHWQPDIGIFVESELWPNMLLQAHKQGCLLALINGRMSQHSYTRWKSVPQFARQILACFAFCHAQSEQDAQRLQELGASHVIISGSLKYDSAPLPVSADALSALQSAIGNRPVWLAASTHADEERQIAEAHRILKEQFPTILTLLVPRHPARATLIISTVQPLTVAQRSTGALPEKNTDIYLADTLGELGLFYRVSPFAFIGGSLIPQGGGHNPFEAAQLGCGVLTGPHFQAFDSMMTSILEAEGACIVENAATLAAHIADLLHYPEQRAVLCGAAQRWAAAQGGTTQRLIQLMTPLLNERLAHAA